MSHIRCHTCDVTHMMSHIGANYHTHTHTLTHTHSLTLTYDVTHVSESCWTYPSQSVHTYDCPVTHMNERILQVTTSGTLVRDSRFVKNGQTPLLGCVTNLVKNIVGSGVLCLAGAVAVFSDNALMLGMCVCMCVHIHTHDYTCTYISICINMCIYVYTYTSTSTYTDMHT